MDESNLIAYQYMGFITFVVLIINLFKKPDKISVLKRNENKNNKMKLKHFRKKKKKEFRNEIRNFKKQFSENLTKQPVIVDNKEDSIKDTHQHKYDKIIKDIEMIELSDINNTSDENSENESKEESKDESKDENDITLKSELKASSKTLSMEEKLQLLDESLWDENW